MGRITLSTIHRSEEQNKALAEQVLGKVKIDSYPKNYPRLENKVMSLASRSLALNEPLQTTWLDREYPVFGPYPSAFGEDCVVVMKYLETEEDYLNPDETLTEDCYAQIQLQMYLAEVEVGYFCLVDPSLESTRRVTIVEVEFDLVKAKMFWERFVDSLYRREDPKFHEPKTVRGGFVNFPFRFEESDFGKFLDASDFPDFTGGFYSGLYEDLFDDFPNDPEENCDKEDGENSDKPGPSRKESYSSDSTSDSTLTSSSESDSGTSSEEENTVKEADSTTRDSDHSDKDPDDSKKGDENGKRKQRKPSGSGNEENESPKKRKVNHASS